MKITAARVLILVVFLAVTVGCHHRVGSKGGGTLPPIDIFMVDATNCDVTARVAVGYMHLNHRFTWRSQDHNAYTLKFRPADGSSGSGSPFKDSQGNYIYNFPVDKTTPTTTPVPSDPGYFEYSIDGGNGQQCKDPKDPGLIVKG